MCPAEASRDFNRESLFMASYLNSDNAVTAALLAVVILVVMGIGWFFGWAFAIVAGVGAVVAGVCALLNPGQEKKGGNDD
jgi:hypothetical protein